MTHETGGMERHWQSICQDKRDLILGGGPFRARSKRQVIARLAPRGPPTSGRRPATVARDVTDLGLGLEGYLWAWRAGRSRHDRRGVPSSARITQIGVEIQPCSRRDSEPGTTC